MSKFLVSLGYKQSIVMPCMFSLVTKDVTDVVDPKWRGFAVSYIVTHVDDMPCASNSQQLLDWTAKQIEHNRSDSSQLLCID